MKVITPATTANIGPGFDCLGMALSLYNTIEAEEMEKGLDIQVSGLGKGSIPLDEKNLVYKSMIKCFEKVGYKPKGLKIKQYNEIPIARGLGSSAACIVGGVVAANELSGNSLNKDEILELAVEIEGHPDNVAPALFGGFVISNKDEERIHYVQAPVAENLKFIAAIPDKTLNTVEARNVLPEQVSFENAVFNVGKSSLLVGALIQGQLEMIELGLEDRLHQPYRIKLMSSLESFFVRCKEQSLENIFLSGAGPTVMMLTEKGKNNKEDIFRKIAHEMKDNWEIKVLYGDNIGVRVL